MPAISFSSQLGNPNATFPSSLIVSLSGVGIDIIALGTNNFGRNVKYIAYNPLSIGSLLSATFNLSAFPGTIARVDRAYNNQTFGVIYDDNTSSLFTLVTAASGFNRQTLTANDSTTYPEWRRLYNLTND